MRWKTICFDLDNTLFSHEKAFEHAIRYCFKDVLKKKNILNKVNIDDLFPVFKKYCDLFWSDYEAGMLSATDYRRKRFLATVDFFKLPFTVEAADEFHDHYYRIVDDFSEPYPFLHSLIRNLTAANVKIGIITNGTADTQYSKIKKLKLNEWLTDDCLFISEELNLSKPDKEIFEFAKKRLKAEGNCLFVGDSWEHDVVGAIEAGWESIFLNTRNEVPKTDHKPVKICSSLHEVALFIYNQNKLKG